MQSATLWDCWLIPFSSLAIRNQSRGITSLSLSVCMLVHTCIVLLTTRYIDDCLAPRMLFWYWRWRAALAIDHHSKFMVIRTETKQEAQLSPRDPHGTLCHLKCWYCCMNNANKSPASLRSTFSNCHVLFRYLHSFVHTLFNYWATFQHLARTYLLSQ